MKSRANNSIICIVAAAALVAVAWASDPWKDKKPAEWTQKQMDKFLTNSPWSNTVQPSSNMPMTGGSPGGPGGGSWGGGGGGMGGGGGRGGGGGMGGGSGPAMPIMTFQIRWLSAPIMREALKVAESDGLNAEIEKYADTYYIIGVQRQVEGGANSGLKTGNGRSGGGQWNGGAPQGQGGANEQSQTRWQQFQPMPTQGASLKFGHELVHPDKAEIGQCKTGMMTLYLFPRSLKLEDADKSYVFEVTQGGFTTRAGFSLKGLQEAPDKGL